MFAAPLPIAISLIAIFNPPAGWEPTWLFGWFFAFIVSLRVCMAAYHTPHLALGGELSSDYTERTRIMSYNTVMGGVAAMAWAFLACSSRRRLSTLAGCSTPTPTRPMPTSRRWWPSHC